MQSFTLLQLTTSWFIIMCVLPGSLQAKTDIKYTPCVQVDACRVHSSAGTKFFKLEAYADALREFHNAYAEQPDPRLLLNIGRTLHLLGKSQEALKYYGRCEEATAQDESLDRELKDRLKDYKAQALQATGGSSASPPPTDAPLASADPPPPHPAASLAPAPASSAEAAAAAPACQEASPPLYKKKWLWATVAASAAAIGLGLGLGLGFGLSHHGNGQYPADNLPPDLKTYNPALTF